MALPGLFVFKITAKAGEKGFERARSIHRSTSTTNPRKELVEQIAKGGGWGRRVQERILKHEVLWVTKRKIPCPAHGRHRKIVSLLEDADTLLAVREYILKAGDSKYILSKVEYRIIKNKSNS